MKRIMMTMAVAAMGMTAMMAQSHEVTTTDKNGNKVVYEISDAAATKGDTLSITTFDPQSVAKSDSINRANREENYELTKEDIRSIMREMDIDTDWVPTALGGMILGGIICVVLPIVIVAAVLLYRYYSRKKKYELAQKILESGQPLPEAEGSRRHRQTDRLPGQQSAASVSASPRRNRSPASSSDCRPPAFPPSRPDAA